MRRRRVRLFREGLPSLDGRIVNGAQWEAGRTYPLYITPDGDREQRLIGQVYGIQRGTDGWVTGMIGVPDDLRIEGQAIEAGFDTANVIVHGSLAVVYGARFRYAVLGERPCWDEMWIGESVAADEQQAERKDLRWEAERHLDRAAVSLQHGLYDEAAAAAAVGHGYATLALAVKEGEGRG